MRVEACLQAPEVWQRPLEQAPEHPVDASLEEGPDRRGGGLGREVAFPSEGAFPEDLPAAEHRVHRVLVHRAFLLGAFPGDARLRGLDRRQDLRPPPACLGEAACRVERLRVDAEA